MMSVDDVSQSLDATQSLMAQARLAIDHEWIPSNPNPQSSILEKQQHLDISGIRWLLFSSFSGLLRQLL